MNEEKKAYLRMLGFNAQIDAVDAGRCPFCKVAVTRDDMRDEISKNEFDLSGVCQICQDKFFKK